MKSPCTLRELTAGCVLLAACTLGTPLHAHPVDDVDKDDSIAAPSGDREGVMSERLESERQLAFNPYVFTTHKQNYMLPVSYTSALNSQVYDQFEGELSEFLKSEEVKFQLSLKVQLNEKPLVVEGDGLFAGFTLEAWWQLYSKDVSSPFRETNYQPEVFYLTPTPWAPLGGSTTWMLGLEHQSNGQIQGLSRSWNRLYTGLLYDRANLFGLLRAWYRLPEKEKENALSADGDDNPDIIDFMGHGELVLGWRGERYEMFSRLRGNTSTGKGAVELSVSFPLFKRFRGVVQYFNGYGDALVDYNHFQQRLGVGVLLSNLF